jgi:putative N6-adenine-specific DNA methylase
MSINDRVKFFVACPPGLEFYLAEELKTLLPQAQTSNSSEKTEKLFSSDESGGFEFDGLLSDIYQVNLQSRVASRVVIRLGSFFAAAFSELEKKTSRLEWELYVQPGQSVDIRVTCHKSKLYHSDAVAERILNAINLHFSSLGKSSPLINPSSTGQLILVRIVRDFCTISIDSSGDALYKRGYKQAIAKAPLRENLAAAMILFSGWKASVPIIDPFCGSGTIPIEASLIANHIPPGINRNFRFFDWTCFDGSLWNEIRSRSISSIQKAEVVISGYDRDAGAIESAQANAARAGQKATTHFSQQAVSYLEPSSPTGMIITNPPYGIRIQDNKDLRNLYSRFGDILKNKFKGWTVVLLGSDDRLIGNLMLGPSKKSVPFQNGGIPVKMLLFEL